MGLRRRRAATPGRRVRVPARSRVTVRRAGGPLPRSVSLAAALKQSRVALANLESQLAAILATLQDPAAQPTTDAADRLRGATTAAGSALAALSGLGRR